MTWCSGPQEAGWLPVGLWMDHPVISSALGSVRVREGTPLECGRAATRASRSQLVLGSGLSLASYLAVCDLRQVPGLAGASSGRGRKGGGEPTGVSRTAAVLVMLSLWAASHGQARWLLARPAGHKEAAFFPLSALSPPPFCFSGSLSLLGPLGRPWEGALGAASVWQTENPG